MKYLGSKRRIAKEILSIMNPCRGKSQTWVEPFAGGCNLIDKVSNPRMANDINKYVMAYLKRISEGWLPAERISEDEYKFMRHNLDCFPPEIVGFSGVCLSFGGAWFVGYARNDSKNDYFISGINNAKKQAQNLKGVEFNIGSYDDLRIPNNSFIYCDPPYRGVTGYKVKFDSDKFFDWACRKNDEGHTVFISEYSAPDYMVCVWEKSINMNINNKNGHKEGKRTEKLFTFPDTVIEYNLNVI